MFASTEGLGAIQKLYFFNDKELPKGSKPERLVSQFLELSVNPKGNSAYKFIFDMTEENNFVTAAVCITVTPTQKALIEHLFANAATYNDYLIDALERATHFCELDLTSNQLRQDYLLRDFAEKLLCFGDQNSNYKKLN